MGRNCSSGYHVDALAIHAASQGWLSEQVECILHWVAGASQVRQRQALGSVCSLTLQLGEQAADQSSMTPVAHGYAVICQRSQVCYRCEARSKAQHAQHVTTSAAAHLLHRSDLPSAGLEAHWALSCGPDGRCQAVPRRGTASWSQPAGHWKVRHS
jgi:hypothetical protein